MPYVTFTQGIISSTVQNVTTSSGREVGTPLGAATTSGSQVATSAPLPCGVSPASTDSGTTLAVATNGKAIDTSYTGTVCVSASTSSYTRYVFNGTFTITGGTGPFSNATGGGRLYSIVTLYPTGDGTQGPLLSLAVGTIRLAT